VKNVTISMDEETLRWVRVEAAKAGLSVSRWIGREIEKLFELGVEKAAARERIKAFLDSGPHFDLSENGKITIDRDELHDDGRFHRFDDPALHSGFEIPDETGTRDAVAEQPTRYEPARPKSSGSE
jgi:hypothetical protein